VDTGNGTNEGVSLGAGLTREEDDELRRLNFLSEVDTVSERKRQRILELRMRDRRMQIRPHRTYAGDADARAVEDERNRPVTTLSDVRTELDQMAALRLLTPFKPPQSAHYDQLAALEKDLLRRIDRQP
jgi:hypothetical protein